ncbi:MAG: alanine racemase, partial [Bacteroidales bacterium]|nr:alanine racemase [Bacteroidales bacterium]
LLNVINTEAGKLGKRVKVLLQLHVALEEQKFGFSPEELLSIAESGLAMNYGNIDFCGIMAMATNTEDEAEIRKEFGYAKSVYSAMRSGAFSGCAHFNTISMGMSGDYQIAIEEGSTMIRIGTFIFGEREY